MGRKLTLNSVEPTRLVAISGDTHYVWEDGQDTVDYLKKMNADHEYEAIHGNKFKAIRLSGVNADYDTDRAYLFYVADCLYPPVYLVFGESFEDAYETFITEFEDLIKIDDADIGDYDLDNLRYNDNGTAVDDESVQFMAVNRLVITVEPARD